MKKKGLASVVLAASMMLAACSGGTTQETTQAPETTAAPETEAETTEEAEAAGGYVRDHCSRLRRRDAGDRHHCGRCGNGHRSGREP